MQVYHGTPEEFLDELYTKIDELAGDDITASTKIYSDTGTPEEFLTALYSKIDELENGSVLESTSVIGSTEMQDTDELIAQVYALVDDGSMTLKDFADEIKATYDNDVAQGAYEGSFNDYLLDTYEDMHDVFSATNTCGIAPAPDLEPIESANTYQDMDGCICGLGNMITIHELEDMYEAGKTGDPSMAQYDDFYGWLNDTVNNGYLKPIDASCDYDSKKKEEIEGAEEYVTDDDIVTREVVQAAEDSDYEIDDEYLTSDQITYLNDLEGMIQKWGMDGAVNDSIDSVLMDHDDETMFLTITFNDDSVVEYEVPLEDLTFSEPTTDFEYITSEIEKED